MEHHKNGDSRKVPSSLYNISCCFSPRQSRYHRHHHSHNDDAASASASPVHVSSCGVLRYNHLPEIKGKCRGLISRIGCGHRRRHSADFHYDALSYSRNFDEGDDNGNGEEFPFRSFSSRLPPSPPNEEDDEEARYTPNSRSTTTTTKEIVSPCG